MNLRVLLADDHRLLREGLRRSLEEAGITIVGEAEDGAHALALSEAERPDIVLMDVSMPILDGVEATRALKARLPEVDVVILTMHADAEMVNRAVRAGAAGYLVKDCTTDDIVATLQAVAAGETVLSPEIASSMLAEARRGEHAPAHGSEQLVSAREQEVLKLIADGASTSEVAASLFISTKTVRHHLSSIYDKLDSRDRTQAILRAVRMGIIRLD